MVEYYKNPFKNDPWPRKCVTKTSERNCNYGHMERDHKYFGRGTPREIFALQPCNYVSNIVFYHSAVRLCQYDKWSIPEEYRKVMKQ